MTTATVTVTEPFQGTLATDENMPYILMCMQAADDIAVDTETSGLNVRNKVDYLMGVCVDVPGVSAYVPFRHKSDNVSRRWLDDMVHVMRDKPLLWHNRKFDMHSFATMGINPLDFKGPQYDSMLLASLVDEELFSKEMDFLARRFLRTGKYQVDVVKKMGEIYGYSNIPAAAYQHYGSYDTVLTRKLKDYFWKRIQQEDLEEVYLNTEMPYTALLYKLEQRGMGVNKEFAEKKASIGNGRMATLRRELDINPASKKDLEKLLLVDLGLPIFKHTKSCDYCKQGASVDSHKGPPSFDKDAMKEYDDILQAMNNPTAKRISEYRGWQKAVSSLYEPLLEKVGPDGRIRTEFQQHRTVTGRLSSSDPNLQQIPRGSDKIWNGDAKSAFVSGFGDEYCVYGWDYSQLEFRLGAAYGREELLLTEFEKDDADPFSAMAPRIYGSLTPEHRQGTKTFTYANLYGARLKKIALTLGMSQAQAEPLYRNFLATIPGITAVSEQVTNLVKQRGYVKYWDGRRRHIKDKADAYKAWNSVLQGGGAQMVKQAMLACEELEHDEAKMVLQVHDEITWIANRKIIPELEVEVSKRMTNFPQFGVRFAVEGKEWK